MAKKFRAWDVDQKWMFPPSVQELVPAGHLAHFVRDTVSEGLDLGEILKEYREERGYAPYHPVMMVALLLYAYCRGIYSSRKMAQACEERVDFMAVTALQKPDFRTISDFRKRHLKALTGLFGQVLKLCQEAGLVKLGHVALDGTKIHANASRHKAMSYGRMKEAEQQLAAEVKKWLEEAERVDARADELYGADQRGDELPEWVKSKKKRLAKIREARQALESEAEAKAEAESKKRKGGTKRGRPRQHPPGLPKPEAQRNFTDPESRIMKTPLGFEQCYNAQAAVDHTSQVIVGERLTNCATDRNELIPMLEEVEKNLGEVPAELSADADYNSEENLKELEERKIRGYVAVGKQSHRQAAPIGKKKPRPGTRRHQMRMRLKKGGYRSRFRLRKQTAEPVFGQIKQARSFRQFLMRGTEKVAAEWSLVCTAHNLLKLAAAGA
jgi:transposase